MEAAALVRGIVGHHTVVAAVLLAVAGVVRAVFAHLRTREVERARTARVTVALASVESARRAQVVTACAALEQACHDGESSARPRVLRRSGRMPGG